MPRDWIKLWTSPLLHGTTSTELELDQEMVFIKLLCLANESPVDGVVCAAKGKPYGDKALAGAIGCTAERLKDTLHLLQLHDKINVNHQGITILNWGEYQDPVPDPRNPYWRDYRRRKRDEEKGEQAVNSSRFCSHKKVEGRGERGGVVGHKRLTHSKSVVKKASGKVTLSPAHRQLFDILKRLRSVKEADADKLVEILKDFPGEGYKGELDYTLIFKAFVEWWPGPKRRTRPWATLRNWMQKEVEDGVRKGRLQKKRVYHAPAGGEDDDDD